MFKKCLLLLSLMMLCFSSYAKIIDIQCEYDLSEPLTVVSSPQDDYSDLGAIPVPQNDYSELGAIPVPQDKREIVNDLNNHKKSNQRTAGMLEILKHPLTFYSYQYAWWIFNRKNIIHFSVNLKSKDVIGGFSDGSYGLTFPAGADIYPDHITIKEQFEDAEKHKHLMHRFDIDRTDGQFFGSYYELDLKTDTDVEKYSMHGKCEPIERLF